MMTKKSVNERNKAIMNHLDDIVSRYGGSIMTSLQTPLFIFFFSFTNPGFIQEDSELFSTFWIESAGAQTHTDI